MTAFALPTLMKPADGRVVALGADHLTIKAQSASDRFILFDYVAEPGLPGPPVHVHGSIEETFAILDGAVDFTVGDRTERLAAGAVAYVPTGVEHTFAVAGSTPARWLGILSPGSGIALLEDLGELLHDGPPDPERLARLFARHDTWIATGGTGRTGATGAR